MPQRTLYSAYTRFASQTYRLVQVFCAPALAPSCELPHVYSAQFSAVRLQMLWGQFCKRVIIESALGNVLTSSGQTLSSRIKTTKGFKAQIRKVNWHIPPDALKQARKWQVENYNQIALGLTSAPMSDVNAFRNYLVHPGEGSVEKLINAFPILRITPESNPYNLLSYTIPGGQSRFEDWVDRLMIAALEAVR